MDSGGALKLKLNAAEDVCNLFPDEAILRKPGTCTETIKCLNGESVPHTVTCTNGKIVKLDKMTCASESDKYCNVRCTKYSQQYIEDPKNCQGWTECDEGKVVQTGNCPDGQMFNKLQQSCILDTGVCNKVYDICQVAKTGQTFWNKSNCRKYYYCNARKVLVSGQCQESTPFYEISTGKCVKKPQEHCGQLRIPEEVCGTQKLAIVDRFVSDQATCSGYFYCKNLGITADGNYIPDELPRWGKCTQPNQFFSEEQQACIDMNSVKCGSDRCGNHAQGLILSEKLGCQHYLVCEDGYTVEEVKCPDEQHFNPLTGSCVYYPVSYPICKKEFI